MRMRLCTPDRCRCGYSQVIGRVGLLHPQLQAQVDVPAVFVFELRSDVVLAKTQRRHQSVSKFPQVRRDLAVSVRRDVAAAEVLNSVREAVGEQLIDVTLFDVYEGEGIDSNEKSLALGLTLQSQTTIIRGRNQCPGGCCVASFANKPFSQTALTQLLSQP